MGAKRWTKRPRTLLVAALCWTGTAGAVPASSWQGAWVIRDAGSPQAWSVRGDRVVVYDAARRETQEDGFAIVSPCRVQRTRVLPSRTTVITYDTFVFARGVLHVARAPAAGGFRRDGVITACIGDTVYRYEPVSAQCWQSNADMSSPPREADAECSVVTTDIGSAFVVRHFDGSATTRLDFYGDDLLSPVLLASVAERWPTFDEAVRRADHLPR